MEAAGPGILMMSAGGFATPALLRLGETALMLLILAGSNASSMVRYTCIAGCAR
jgi:hypothetical protein